MINVYGTLSADTANALANTDLQSAPDDGVLVVQLVATQTDWEFSLSAGQDTPVRVQKVAYKASATINENDDPSVTLPVLAGQQLILNINVVTAGTGAYLVRFFPEDEL